ncbi:right-handed parallel beta-helix repeat-containing protein [uncultured Draconibacterium sp.]|uniref:right-handed parallel beta-helix repeat-containing protein n=1 Tax=uncultured Draconibacterium sp. TaxID=1573823 RepID=UPI0029C697F0|nr:right-handed parallel beta-helix repeat-containing protein [uncultured Draconibacterium sp.]
MKYLLLFSMVLTSFIANSCEKVDVKDDDETIPEEQTVYYINSQEDFDKWSYHVFPAGSKVLFAAGKTFSGQFILRGSGTENKPNLAAAYDSETEELLTEWVDNKALIEGEGKVNSALKLSNGSFWEINNIEVTNTDGTDNDQGDLRGIHVVAQNAGTIKNITIKNCHVHDVNGKVGGKMRGGIHVHVLGNNVKTKFHNLLIENNVVENVGGVGIGNQSSWGGITSPEYDPWTNFAIRGNRVEHTGRNGIIIRYARDAVVEYNKLVANSRYDSGHSVFNFNTINCVVQYNEAYGNTSDDPDEIDHGGFDADYNSRGTIIQYNYSHDNNWFCGIMRKPVNTDITIRYNISQNELLGAFLYGFPTNKGVKDVKIYNNTLYFGKGKGNRVFVAAGKFRTPTETEFRNNIFYFEDEAEWGFEPDGTCVFENNLYYNVSSRGANAVTADPLFIDPGSGGTDIDMTDPDRLAGYKLASDSPALNTGLSIENSGDKNFQGKQISAEIPNIGAL